MSRVVPQLSAFPPKFVNVPVDQFLKMVCEELELDSQLSNLTPRRAPVDLLEATGSSCGLRHVVVEYPPKEASKKAD